MTSMVEMVARALFDARYDTMHNAIMYGNERITFDEILAGVKAGVFVEHALEKYFAEARAAIAAMREPSSRMVHFAFVEMNKTPGGTWKKMKSENKTQKDIFSAKMIPRYTAMIDAALEE